MDNRVFQAGASASVTPLPVSPSTGYPTSGDPLTAQPATVPGPYWFYQIGEELRGVLLAAGITPDHEDLSQLAAAVVALAGAPQLVKQATAAQAYAKYAQYTFAHTLGVVPGVLQLKARCLTAEGGYTVGDVVYLPVSNDEDASSGNDLGYVTKATASNIYLSLDKNHELHFHEWDSNSRFTLTDGYWELFFFAMA